MKTFKQFLDELNAGPSTPVSNSGGKIMPNFGSTRIGKIRPKGGKTIADIVKGI